MFSFRNNEKAQEANGHSGVENVLFNRKALVVLFRQIALLLLFFSLPVLVFSLWWLYLHAVGGAIIPRPTLPRHM